MPKRSLLFVGAHPDDETLLGPLFLKYSRAGHDVHLLSITAGQKGVRPHYGMAAGPGLGGVRAEEFRCSARLLGAREPILLGYEDQGIAALDVFWEIVGRLRDVVNHTRPDVILTWGPDGVTGHIDHRVAAELATTVFQERRLLRCDPKKLYYFGYPESILGANANPLDRKRDFLLLADRFITTVVDCTETAEDGLRALECHRTQWRPERVVQLKALYRDVLRSRAWLRLALTTLPWPRERESCLFEGLD
jgi:LmbE family N-acetylglucosaminyl deacetylase